MNELSDQQAATRPKLLVNLGSGPKGQSWLPAMFAEWRQFRVDVDPNAAPDLLGDITDLSAIKSGSADALSSAPCIQHLSFPQARTTFHEAHPLLSHDG